MSALFELDRGTRQGCPLSPLMFALAIEPLAALVWSIDNIAGLKYAENKKKSCKYMLLSLGNTGSSLRAELSAVSVFGIFSDLTVNWMKSASMQLDQTDTLLLLSSCPVPVVHAFKYLGIAIELTVEL